MKRFTSHRGITAPLIRNNIDTDAIIPSVEMKRVSKKGLASGLFASWRYTDRRQRKANPDFVLNQPAYQNASILLAGKNFGCGSSREHAVWALAEFGIRVIIAESFGAIFRSNCIANGLLPISLEASHIAKLAKWVESDPPAHHLLIDLEQRKISAEQGLDYTFSLEDSDALMLLNGWDPIAMTLHMEEQIKAFLTTDRKARPWVYL